MPVIATNQADASGQIVNVMLNGGRVTSSFRASLFAAAAREGMSVNQFVLTAAAEKLKAAGAPFDGVFAAGDLTSKNLPDPFAGSNHRVAIELGSGFVTEAEKAAFEALKPRSRTFFELAISLMREAVLARASR